MDVAETESVEVLQARIAEAGGKLNALAEDLQAVEAELGALAPEQERYALLEQACGSLEKLKELGAAGLFWGERLPEHVMANHVRDVRKRVQSFQERVGGIVGRRQQILESVDREQEALELLEEDLYQAEQQEERNKLEWVVERDVSLVQSGPQLLAWARRGEEDARFRRTLAAAMLVALLFAFLLPLINLPTPTRSELVEVPERLAQLVQERAKLAQPPAPPPVRELQPEEKKPEPEEVPTEKPQAPQEEKPQLASAGPQTPEKSTAQKGLLAFRERFASLRESRVAPKLGLQARISSADDSVGRTERAMLTSNAPGSSGGINLAALSRNVGSGGGGAGGGIQGTALTRASSSIASIGPGDRPLSGGPGPARTDEEIQIVFDRHKSALYRLYNRELRKDPTLQGKMILRLTIEPDGSVSFCQLQSSDMNAPELSAQIVDRVKTFDFGAKDVAAITIVYPIDFLPAA